MNIYTKKQILIRNNKKQISKEKINKRVKNNSVKQLKQETEVQFQCHTCKIEIIKYDRINLFNNLLIIIKFTKNDLILRECHQSQNFPSFLKLHKQKYILNIIIRRH